MTSERSKRRDFLSLIFIAKSIPKKLLINHILYDWKRDWDYIRDVKIQRRYGNDNVA